MGVSVILRSNSVPCAIVTRMATAIVQPTCHLMRGTTDPRMTKNRAKADGRLRTIMGAPGSGCP